MTSTFFGLNTALTGLQAQQMALNVTAHNVANANTDGYSRQEVDMTATYPYTVPTANRGVGAGQIGTGVEVENISRVRDQFLDSQIRSQLSAQGSWQTTQDYLGQLESVFNEPSDSGLSTLFGTMWNAWQDLSVSPDSTSAKAAVVQAGTGLADELNRDASQLSTLRDQAGQEAGLNVSDVNSDLQQIADLNNQIQKVQLVGDQPNDLMDKRDLLLDKLATTLPISYQQDAQGQLTITLGSKSGGPTLVSGSSYGSLQSATNADGTLAVTMTDSSGTSAGDVTSSLTSGTLGGLIDVHDQVLNPSYSGSLAWRLNQLASTLITQVNKVYDPSGATKFFDGTDASNISVDGSLVNDPTTVRSGSSGAAGDGSVALAIANLQTTVVDCNGDGQPDSTIGDWYNQLVTKLGSDSQQAQQMTTNQKALVNQLTTSRQSNSGVSLDEEATNMVKYQRAYEASARVMTAMDQMLETLINSMGT